ncbi:MAG: HepT-like ribonuclease domain-containing protein [Bacteroidota bacterium]
MFKNRDEGIILLMLETIGKIFLFTSDHNSAETFEKDIESFDATVMNFIVLGEAVGRLSEPFKENHGQIDWRKIYAFRNVLAHDYFGIYSPEIWEIIRKHLPELKKSLENIL